MNCNLGHNVIHHYTSIQVYIAQSYTYYAKGNIEEKTPGLAKDKTRIMIFNAYYKFITISGARNKLNHKQSK